jgi:aspartate aminotransferase-like enzyme
MKLKTTLPHIALTALALAANACALQKTDDVSEYREALPNRAVLDWDGDGIKEVLDGLRYIYNTQNDVLCFTSSGSGAMEGAVVNLLSPGDKGLVVSAGKFGERWTNLCKAFGVAVNVVSIPTDRQWTQTVAAELKHPILPSLSVSESSTGPKT